MPPPRTPNSSNGFHNNRHTYIPEHAQKIMAKKLEQTVPSNPHPGTVANFQQQNHFQQLEDQQSSARAESANSNAAVSSPPPSPVSAQAQVTPEQPITPPEPYDFIMKADKKPTRAGGLPNLDSTLKRAAFAIGGLFVILIVFIVIKSLLAGTSNLTLFVGIAQDQQEMIHLTTNAGQQQGLTTANQNFAATTNASLTSAQSAIVTYLANNKQKVNSKQLNLKLSQQTDTQLTNAAASGTYDQTFQQVVKAQLTSYINDLNQAYRNTKGKKGRALLVSDYTQAKLLLSQLNTAGQ